MENVIYARVSSVGQNIDRQLKELRKAGVEASQTFIEKASGSTAKRPVLEELIKYVRKGDVVHVHSIDRMARSIIDLNTIVAQLTQKGCVVKFHKESLSFGNGNDEATSKLMFNILGSFAEFERSLIKERQAEGIAAAKAKGKKFGRPSLLSSDQKEEIIKKYKDGNNPTQLSKKFGVSRALIYKIVKETQG